MTTFLRILNYFIIFTAVATAFSAYFVSGANPWDLLPKQCGRRFVDVVDTRVMGGQISQPGRHPWIVNLFAHVLGVEDYPLQPICGGAILSESYVLTAGHCCLDIFPNQTAFVRVGEFDLLNTWKCKQTSSCATNTQDIQVEHFTVTDNWFHNDLCLVRLKTPIDFNNPYVEPICLPSGDILTADKTGLELELAGWGNTISFDQGYTKSLLEARLNIMSYPECNTHLTDSRYVPDASSEFCALGRGQTACFGDSGSPVVYSEDGETFTLVGVTSHPIRHNGLKCSVYMPSVYTDVTKHVQWILDNIKP